MHDTINKYGGGYCTAARCLELASNGNAGLVVGSTVVLLKQLLLYSSSYVVELERSM